MTAGARRLQAVRADAAASEGADLPAAELLSIDGLGVVYKTKRGAITALKELTFDVREGEFVSVVGPSGCGKSTLLKIVAGLNLPTAGKVTLRGMPIAGPRSDIGVVFQKPSLMPWKSVVDNVLVTTRALRMDPGKARRRALELLTMVGLDGFTDNYPGELSGGMQQRVGLVRGLVHDPSLLLMDEPFAALDAMTREHMALELQQLWMSTRKSVIFITHSIPEAVFLADRVLVMSQRPGRIIDEVHVGLPRPRGLETMAAPEFGALCNRLRERFRSVVALD